MADTSNMGEAKASGLRPPSKIGRPCCALPPKPAVPVSPPRSSLNTSVVLTVDTDSFIIGDRVWVGGTKPGSIAYIGETKFAPGDWAGIVLDEPIGKNDGSVVGTRYFQCEPKRGIFSRLTRLTRQPLSDAALAEAAASQKTPTSPSESTKGTLNKSMSPSLNTSTTSLSSVSHRDLRIGERVIVSSSQGSKTGVLRFLGTTHFANGEFCGVELDDPLGKNDGSIDDIRYFEARPKHGLFAPVHKVSRSPSNRRTSSCIVHKPTGAALNMSLRKLGSRESLASVSSIASTTASTATRGAPSTTARRTGLRTSTPARSSLQEMLKEKQMEIDFLRKERDLERERVTKAANQADNAEQSAATIREEYEKYRELMEKNVQDAQTALAKLLDEKNALTVQLEEEKRKSEDLLFRFEEESVNKDDIQKERTDQSVTNALNESKIEELQKQLSEERERVVQLEHESTKLFEVEEELTRLKNELSSNAAQDNDALQDLRNLNENLENTKINLEQEVKEKDALVLQYVERIKVLELKLNEREQEMGARKEFEDSLQKDSAEIKQSLQEKCSLIENLRTEFEASSDNLKKEIERLKKSIEDMTNENKKEKESLIADHKRIIEEKDNIIQEMIKENEARSSNDSDVHREALERLSKENAERIQQISNEFDEKLKSKDAEIQKFTEECSLKNVEIERLTKELISQENHCKVKDEQLRDLQQRYEDLTKLVESLKTQESELSKTYTSKTAEIEELKRNFQKDIADKERFIQEITTDSNHKTQRLNVVEREVAELKSFLANKEEEIKTVTDKTAELRDAMTLSEQTKTNLESELRIFESNVEILNQKLARSEEKVAQLTEQKEKLELDVANAISTSADSSDQLLKYNEDLRKKEKELDEARDKGLQVQNLLTSTEAKLQEIEQALSKTNAAAKELDAQLNETRNEVISLKKINEESSAKIALFQKREQELLEIVDKNKLIEENLNAKVKEISDLEIRLKKSQEEASGLNEKCMTLEKLQQGEKSNLDKLVEDLTKKLTSSAEDLRKLQESKEQVEADRNVIQESLKELTNKLTSVEDDRSKLDKMISEKDSELTQLKHKVQDLEKQGTDLKSVADKYIEECNNYKKQIEERDAAHDKSKYETDAELKTVKDQLISITTTSEELKKTLETEIKSANELRTTLATVQESTKIVEEKASQLDNLVKQKDNKIVELEKIFTTLKGEKQRTEDELKILKDGLRMKEMEVSSISEGQSEMQQNINSLEKQVADTKAALLDKDNKIKELASQIDAVIKDKEQSVKELKSTMENEVTAKQQRIEAVVEQNNVLEKEKNTLQDAMNKQSSEINVKDAFIAELISKIKSFEEIEKEKTKTNADLRTKEFIAKQNEIEEIRKQNSDLQAAKDSLEKLVQKKSDNLKQLTTSMEKKEQEAEKKVQNLTEKLSLFVSESTQLKEAQSRLEKENKQLTAKWIQATEDMKLMLENKKNNQDIQQNSNSHMIQAQGDTNQHNNGTDMEPQKLLEEYEMAKGQIEFLNSVIVDMQRKNETLLCKIEVLEMGVPANEADDYNRHTLDQRKAAPRMFCDICDQFDLHDTEDCPRQAQDFVEPDLAPKSPKKPPVERPYCDNCEMFGHDTLDCDDAETF
ncbi:restin homolog isoform X2 [Cephus cinctus]|uniref:Restin homolog isoform X2 n=1 Tax=Cephus cinctus TaxID=211228 RepID=A0AAJ7C6J2_CEPCN|nr:restin homolog isoform X2 [Cephus cinctus]